MLPGFDDDMLMGGFSAPPTLRFSGSTSASPATISLATAAVGDLMCVAAVGFTTAPTVSGGGGGWHYTAVTGLGHPYGLLWKVLDAADIAAGSINVTNDGRTWWVDYLAGGPTSAAVKTQAESAAAASTLVLPAFSRGDNSAAVLAFIVDFDSASPADPAMPANWVSDYTGVQTWRMKIARVAADNYDDGTITFTGFTTGQVQGGFSVELTGG